jgi:hypothetical protein
MAGQRRFLSWETSWDSHDDIVGDVVGENLGRRRLMAQQTDPLTALVCQWLDSLPGGRPGSTSPEQIYARLTEFASADAAQDWWPGDPWVMVSQLIGRQRRLWDAGVFVNTWGNRVEGGELALSLK